AAVATKGRLAAAGDSADGAGGGVEAAHPAVQPVGDVEIAGAVEHYAVGLVERRPGGGAAIAGIALFAIAGDGGDDAARRIDAADAVVEGVGEIEVGGAVKGDIERAVQQCRLRRPAVTGKAFLADADRRRNRPPRHTSNPPAFGAPIITTE